MPVSQAIILPPMMNTCIKFPTTNLGKTSHRSSAFETTPEDDELEVVFVDDGEEEPHSSGNDDSDDGEDEESNEFDDEEYNGIEDGEEEAPAQADNHIPFWFSHEDEDQVCKIMEYYTRFLDLETERKLCLRAPMPFIGRVRRTRVKNEMFSTLDEVSVYLRDIKPLGVKLPLVRTVWQVTSWDVAEGIPLHSFEIRTDSLRAFWHQRTFGADSFLYCRPIFHSKDWQFQVSEQETLITYTCLHSNTPCYGPYIPSKCLHLTSSLGDN